MLHMPKRGSGDIRTIACPYSGAPLRQVQINLTMPRTFLVIHLVDKCGLKPGSKENGKETS